jgi:hypothetical protein
MTAMDDAPTFDEFVDVMRQRIADADALKPGELHDIHELMRDYEGKVGENWYENAFDELEAQGHLDQASGKAMGPTMHGRLSADGRAYLGWQDQTEEPEDDF